MRALLVIFLSVACVAQLNAQQSAASVTWVKGKGKCKRFGMVFGLKICVSAKSWSKAPDKCDHIANILAQLIDNDADGVPDDLQVHERMVQQKMGIWVGFDEKESGQYKGLPAGRWQGSAIFEAVLNSCDVPTNRGATTNRQTWSIAIDDTWIDNTGCSRERDATVEECHHLLNEAAAEIYPAMWGQNFNSKVGKAISNANGNCGWGFKKNWKNPGKNGLCEGQFAYSDKTCNARCNVVEGTYWASITYVGGFFTKYRARTIDNEWLMATPDTSMRVLPADKDNARSLQAGSPDLYALVSDTTSYGHRWLPDIMPNGRYSRASVPPSTPYSECRKKCLKIPKRKKKKRRNCVNKCSRDLIPP